MLALQRQASLCDFRVRCLNDSCQSPVSFSEEMISGQLIAGLANIDHQGKVLAESDNLPSLQAKFNKLVSLETTDQATSRLHTLPSNPLQKAHSETAAQKTAYVQLKNARKLATNSKNGQTAPPCKGCGEITHPSGKSMSSKDCQVFTLICRNCGMKGHLEKVCRQPKRSQSHPSSLHATHCQPATTSSAIASSPAQASSEASLPADV